VKSVEIRLQQRWRRVGFIKNCQDR